MPDASGAMLVCCSQYTGHHVCVSLPIQSGTMFEASCPMHQAPPWCIIPDTRGTMFVCIIPDTVRHHVDVSRLIQQTAAKYYLKHRALTGLPCGSLDAGITLIKVSYSIDVLFQIYSLKSVKTPGVYRIESSP